MKRTWLDFTGTDRSYDNWQYEMVIAYIILCCTALCIGNLGTYWYDVICINNYYKKDQSDDRNSLD